MAVEQIKIPDFFSDEWIEIDVERPDFSLLSHSIYDYSGLVRIVREVFGENVEQRASNGTGRDDEDEIELLIDDLCRRTLVSPTFDEFESTFALDDKQKSVIARWVMREAQDLQGIVRNKDVAMPIIVQAVKFDKTPAEIIDPRNKLSGITHISFNRAMAEYLLFLEDEKMPLDYNKKATNVSNVDFLDSIGAGPKTNIPTSNMDNTIELLKAMGTKKG